MTLEIMTLMIIIIMNFVIIVDGVVIVTIVEVSMQRNFIPTFNCLSVKITYNKVVIILQRFVFFFFPEKFRFE